MALVIKGNVFFREGSVLSMVPALQPIRVANEWSWVVTSLATSEIMS